MSNELANLKQNAGLPAVPDYLRVADDHSLDGVKQYVRPPRIKVIQATSDQNLLATFGVGSTVLVPDNLLIMEPARDEKGNVTAGNTPPFLFTPIFFFNEFCLWNPIQMKGKLPAIRDRSFDQNSDVAIRARNFKDRTMPCPEAPEYNCVFCEHMNFIVHVHGQKEHCILTFSRGEFKAGTNFAALLKMRSTPLYAGIFAANLVPRKNDKGSWYGLDISNPSDGSPYVGEEAFQLYQKFYKEYAELYSERKIDVVYEDDPIDVEPVSAAADTM